MSFVHDHGDYQPRTECQSSYQMNRRPHAEQISNDTGQERTDRVS